MSQARTTTFDQFASGFGFEKFPFNQYSTENELQIREKLFYSPSEYSPIIEAFSSGQTMLILGNRGTGKTALLYDIKDKANENTLVAWVDDFAALPTPFSSEDFYKIILKKLVEQLFLRLVIEKKRIKKLGNDEKVLLVYLLKTYFPTISKTVLVQKIEEVSQFWGIPTLKKIYNFSRDLLNYGVSSAIQLSSDAVRQHFTSLPAVPKDIVLRSYFPEIKYVAEQPFEEQPVTYDFIVRCLNLITRLGYSRFTLILDKIDEDSRLVNDAEEIANFIQPVLTDNKLLLNQELQLIVSLWNIPFSFLADQVRSQKHFTSYTKWERDDLEGALNKRIDTFSNGIVSDYREIFDDHVTDNDFAGIFRLANGNPRDLWHILKYIFHAQYKNNNQMKLSVVAIIQGLSEFVREFNYYEYYPRKVGSRENSLDVYSYVRHLLRLGKKEFTRSAFQEATGVSGGSVNNYFGQMQRMGLIIEFDRKGTSRIYKIVDPKIEYAIDNGVNISRVTT